MKLITRTIYFACISICITSCSKSNKDFVGEYTTKITVDVIAANAKSFLPATGEMEFPTGFKTPDLAPIELKLFIDESTEKLSGQGTLNVPFVIETSFGNEPKRKTKNFDVIGEHIVNDTLYFTIQPVSSSKRIDAYLVKNGNKSFIGIDKTFTSSLANGPYFNTTNGKYTQYNTNDLELSKKSKEFILQQFKRNDSLITNSTETDFMKKRLRNANTYYNQTYLKK